MFENAQPEPSSGTGKIIGVVIVVVLVALVAFYFLFLKSSPSGNSESAATTSTAAATSAGNATADPAKDLVISKNSIGRDSRTQTMAMMSVVIENRSKSLTYKNIQYATTYYDGQHNVVYQGSGTLPGEVAPGDSQTFSDINDGLYPMATASYTIEIKGAQASQQ